MSSQEQCLDHTICQQMSSLVELLTTSGKPVLNPEIMKKFKKICRTSDMYVEHAFHLLMSQLSTDHSEVRLSTFQIMDELFSRSHAFRELLVADFQTFLELTVGIDQDRPLPPPKFSAQTMKNQAYKSIQQWYEKFGEAYKKLILGYQFLKTCKKVDFDGIQARTELERRQKEEAEKKVAESRKIKVDKVLNEFKDRLIDIELCVTEIENSIQLLLPHPDDFFIGVPEQTEFSSSSTAGTVLNSSGSCSTGNTSARTNTEKTSDGGACNSNSGKMEFKSASDSEKHIDDKTLSTDSNSSDKHASVKENSTKRFDTVEQSVKCGNGTHEHKTGNKHEDSGKAVDVKETSNNDNVDRTCESVEEVENEGGSDEEEEEEEEEFEPVDDSTNPLRHQLGLFNHTFSLTVEMEETGSKLKETEDNREIIQGLREQYRLVKTKYMPSVKKWLHVMGKNGAKEDNIKEVIDLKSKLEDATRKCIELEVVTSTNKDQSSSDSEEDFEDVQEKDGYEADIPEHVRLEAARSTAVSTPMGRGRGKKRGRKSAKVKDASAGKSSLNFWKLSARVDEDVRDPTTWKSNIQKLQPNSKATSTVTSAMIKQEPVTSAIIKQEPGTSGSSGTSSMKPALLDKAPVISYGLDLEHWENPNDIKAPMKVVNEDAGRVWIGNSVTEEKVASSMEIETLTSRSFTFAGKFEPVKWKCRAPLLNGKQCERMDRDKCPFHGKIIGRDKEGKPTNPDDVNFQNTKTHAQGLEGDWQDPELLADIEAQTGVDLGSSKSKGKGKGKGKKKAEKRKYPNLTDIKASKKTSRSRLEAKIFKKGTLKKVNAALDAVTVKRLADKFGNQFNYSLK